MSGSADHLHEHRLAAVRRCAQLDTEIARLRLDRGSEAADDEHDPEGPTLSAEWSRLEGLRTAALTELAEIDAAIARSHSGSYGTCVTCGRAIPAARLEALPAATRCVDCASRGGR